MESPIEMDDLGVPLFLETAIYNRPMGSYGTGTYSLKLYVYLHRWRSNSPKKLITLITWFESLCRARHSRRINVFGQMIATPHDRFAPKR